MATELIQATTPSDLIFATGKTWYGRDLVKELFASYGLHYCKHLLERAPKLDPVYFQVDIDETVRHLGRIPQRDILDVCRDFITVDGPR